MDSVARWRRSEWLGHGCGPGRGGIKHTQLALFVALHQKNLKNLSNYPKMFKHVQKITMRLMKNDESYRRCANDEI